MIPYTLMHVLIHSQNEIIDASVIDLAYDTFTFRLFSRKLEQINLIEVRILRQEPILLSDYELILEEDGYAVIYRIITVDVYYQNAARKLMKDYSHYVELKNEHTWNELSHDLVNYPLEDHFYDSFSEQYRDWLSQKADQKWKSLFDMVKEYGIILSIKDIDLFLKKDLNDFLDQYYNNRLLSNHPIVNKRVDYIYIGSQYCFHLLPDIHQIQQVVNKAHRLNIKVVLMTPPLKQSELYQTVDLCKEADEVVVNDYGLLHVTQHTYLGVLLNKYTKDSRSEYVKYNNCQNDLNNEFYRKYLNMDGYCYESGNLMKFVENSIIFFPYYTLNTATFCTLYSLYHFGNRSFQHKLLSCNQCCLDHEILYPDHLNMVGRYNSLLCFNKDVLFNNQKLEKYLKARRMVLNL